MRTKTLLLTAGALLAAGLISSQAQPVYSANIVGYASVPTPGNGASYFALSIPFNIGVSNGANEIWPPGTLPDFSSILLWNGSGYTGYYADSSSPSGWDDSNFSPLSGAPTLPVGRGFFLIPSAPVTNTFAGTVAVNVGTSNKMVLNGSGATYYMVGCPVPYAGAVTNGNNSGGGPNLSPASGLPDFSSILIWNGSGYTGYYSDSSSPSGWDDSNFSPLASPPSISVGQGFFIVPSANFTWTVGL